MKKTLSILLIVMITCFCIAMGIRTRKQNAISVTQIQTNAVESLSYLIETKNHHLMMIDGGSYEDSEHLETILQEKGGVVESWFITIAHSQNFGALQRILENDKIQINHIYISFQSSEWYQTYEPDRYSEIAQFLDLIYSQPVIAKVQDIPERFTTLVDNLYITALNVKNGEMNRTYAGFNQSMAIKVSNTYKSVIFMGNMAEEAGAQFLRKNSDEINCDAVQISNNQQQSIPDEVYQEMSPEFIFVPVPTSTNKENTTHYLDKLNEKIRVEQTHLSCDGDTTVKIW